MAAEKQRDHDNQPKDDAHRVIRNQMESHVEHEKCTRRLSLWLQSLFFGRGSKDGSPIAKKASRVPRRAKDSALLHHKVLVMIKITTV